MTKEGLVVIGRFLATAMASLSAVFISLAVTIGDTIAIAGCAICDDVPPNYVGAILVTAIGLALLWLDYRIWRAACATGGYR